MKYKIAVITPKHKNDYLTDTVLDGLLELRKENKDLEFHSPSSYPYDFTEKDFMLSDLDFVNFAKTSDLVLFMWGKDNTDYEKAENINEFGKTVFIDGSEVGKNGRFDAEIQKGIIDGTYNGRGKIDLTMEKKCALYFRREKPYLRNIIPFPFGIEKDYLRHYSSDLKKDLDFFCVFGQDEYPILRREVREVLIEFCRENNFSYFADKTDKDNFYKKLARSKVGISVGGGGFDTARFWEILGNNCFLLTEKIDIYEKNSERLKYKRVWQFDDLSQFKLQLEKMSQFLKSSYGKEDLGEEYKTILADHSSKSRVLEVIQRAIEKGIIQ